MKPAILATLVALTLIGCGGTSIDTNKIAEAIDDQNTTVIVEPSDPNITVLPSDTNITVPPSDVNVTVENDVTINILINDIINTRTGTFEDPIDLVQAVYRNLEGRKEYWFSGQIFNSNTTLIAFSPVVVRDIRLYDNDRNLIFYQEWVANLQNIRMDINSTGHFMLYLMLDQNGSVQIKGQGLYTPEFYTR